jgi:hypothetical protein
MTPHLRAKESRTCSGMPHMVAQHCPNKLGIPHIPELSDWLLGL